MLIVNVQLSATTTTTATLSFPLRSGYYQAMINRKPFIKERLTLQWGVTAMVKVRSEEETRKNTVQGSINAYLNGKKNLNWVVAIIESNKVKKGELENWLIPLRESNPDKLLLSQLEKTCKEKGFL